MICLTSGRFVDFPFAVILRQTANGIAAQSLTGHTRQLQAKDLQLPE
jgi:hypothetical protein